MPFGDGEVVHHGRARHVDDLALDEIACSVCPVIDQVGWREAVAEEVHLSGHGAELGMGGHCGCELAAQIVDADGFELARDLR